MTQDPSYVVQPAAATRRGSGLAVAAMVLGILALLLCWTVIGGVLLGLLAVVLGVVASGRARRGLGEGRGMAIAGIVLGVLGLLISVALVVFGFSFMNGTSGKNLRDCLQNAGDDRAKVQQCQRDLQRDLEG